MKERHWDLCIDGIKIENIGQRRLEGLIKNQLECCLLYSKNLKKDRYYVETASFYLIISLRNKNEIAIITALPEYNEHNTNEEFGSTIGQRCPGLKALKYA